MKTNDMDEIKFFKYGNTLIAKAHIESIEQIVDSGTHHDQSQWLSYEYKNFRLLIHLVSGKTITIRFNDEEAMNNFVKDYLL